MEVGDIVNSRTTYPIFETSITDVFKDQRNPIQERIENWREISESSAEVPVELPWIVLVIVPVLETEDLNEGSLAS